jgi:hypothetical protein
MAIGPLESFVFPSVLVRTINEASGTTAAGSIRYPAFIGVSAEETRVSDFEMIRGSSAVADNLILEEDVGSQFDGTNKSFTVANYPIVTGDGSGSVATSPSSVIVTVNQENVAVNSVNGLTGEVTLVETPQATDDVRANYYFKRRDTYVENEDLSAQADGSNTSFKVKNRRIVKGDNGGRSATDDDIGKTVTILYNPDPLVAGDEFETDVQIIEVTVDGAAVTISELDGADGTFTLASAPAASTTVLVNYFTNTYQDTYDILPAAVVNRVTEIGLSQDTADFSIGDDAVLSGQNRLHWGHSYQKETGVYTTGSDALADKVVVSLLDNRVFGRICDPVSPAVDGAGNPLTDADGNEINLDGNKSFELPTNPVNGDGSGTPTEDPADITAYVGATWAAAKTAGAVTVTKVDGNVITLNTSPSQALEEKVYASYHENLLVDDTWTLTNRVPGGDGVGKYTVESRLHGNALDVVQNGGTASPVYAGAGAYNVQVDPLKGSVERVTITFDGVGGFTVTSKLGPAFTEDGRTGSVITLNQNKGYTGKTYIDPTTLFRVTFTDNLAEFNPGVGDTVIYDIGDPTTTDATEKIYITADSSFMKAVPGLNLTVSTTDGGAEDNTDDTVIIETYNKSGNEPDVGDTYYVTFDKTR